MNKLTVLLLTILTVNIATGQICHGKQVVMTQDGQCDYNDYMLEFEDNFDGRTIKKNFNFNPLFLNLSILNSCSPAEKFIFWIS
jgi:hypothetical protein